jgi:hypothetical protein
LLRPKRFYLENKRFLKANANLTLFS